MRSLLLTRLKTTTTLAAAITGIAAPSVWGLTPRSQAFHVWVDSTQAYFDVHPELKDQSGTGWFPFLRMKWAEEQRLSAGELPLPAARWDNVEEKKLRSSGLSSLNPTWVELAPNGATASATSPFSTCPNQAIAGRMLDIEFDPNFDPGAPGADIIYAAAAGGGLWKSTDFGASWQTITESIAALPVGGVAVSRSNPSIIVIGTGEGTFVEGFFYSGVGILRSTNSGATWSETTVDGDSWPEQEAGLGFHFVEAGPAGADSIFLAGATDGLYRSTDHGATWALVDGSAHFYDAKWKPGSTSIVYSCQGNESSPATSSGVWRSTNGGVSWSVRIGTGQPAASTIGKTKLAVSVAQPNWLYALYAEPGLGVGFGGGGARADLYRSTNAGVTPGGVTWTRQKDDVPIGSQLAFNLCIVANPTNAQVLFAGGVLGARSTDSGVTWVTPPGPPGCFKDHHALGYEPQSGNGSRLWIAGDAGVFFSDNDATSWTVKINKLATLQFYDVGVNNGATAPWILGGAQDNGLYQWRSGFQSWDSFSSSADGMVCAINASDGKTGYACFRPNQIFYRTTNMGDSWAGLSPGGGIAILNPLDVDPSDGTIYRRFSANPKVRKSENSGDSWTGVSDSSAVWISISPVDGNVVWWVYGDGSSSGVQLTTNNGSSLIQASPFGFDVDAPTKILAHPTQSTSAFVAFSGYASGKAHLARTTNSGSSWTNVTGDLLNEPVNAIVVNPSNPSQWFVGTDSGVWMSTDAGEEWDPFGMGLPHAYIFDLEIQNARQRLIAATHGRAAWDVDIMAPGASVAWSDSVYLDADFLIPEGATLTIAAGTKVFVSSSDRQNIGIDAGTIEIINKGTMAGIGGTGVGQGILFTGAAGAWHGIRMELAGCQYSNPDSAWMASAYPISRLENVTIENALYGVRIEGFIAPSLVNVTFQGITNERDVYLDRTDVFIPRGQWATGPCASGWSPTALGEWRLLPGTDVVAANSTLPGKDAAFGEPGKVDLIVHGKLVPAGTSANRVRFQPEFKDNVNANNWGGLWADWPAQGTDIDFSEISHAKIPLTFYYAGSLSVRRSWVHHFQQTGIKVIQSGGTGAIIDSCHVERGSGLAPANGNTGIYLEKTGPVIVQRNTVDFTGYSNPDVSGAGIHILNTRPYCDTAPSAADSVAIYRNVMKGPGTLAANNNCTGLKMEWACGSGPRLVWVSQNRIKEWNAHGMFMYQNSDVQVNCNILEANRTNVDFTRTASVSPSQPGGRFRWNFLEVPLVEYNLRTDDALKLELGPNASDRGQNHIKTALLGAIPFIKENDNTGSPPDTLNAVQNRWFLADSILTNVNGILDRIDESPQAFISPLYAQTPPCGNDVPGGVSLRMPNEALEPEGVEARVEAGVSLVEIPLESFLAEPRPSPGRGITEVPFGLAGTSSSWASLRVYGVDGRLVRTLFEEAIGPGYYRREWDGRNDRGERVSAGVYFVRFETKGFQRTQKLVRLN